MKKQLISLFILLVLGISSKAQQWQQKANFPVSLFNIAFSIKNKQYILEDGRYNSKSFWEYDAIKDIWTQKADFPGKARCFTNGGEVDGKGYLGIGTTKDGIMLNDFWEYNSVTDTWLQKADYPGTKILSPMVLGINGKIYTGLGSEPGGLCNDEIWEYTPETDSWNKQQAFPGGNRFTNGVSINGKAYIGLGLLERGVSSNTVFNDFWEYTPETDSWKKLANFPGQERILPVFFTINNRCFMGCGLKDTSTHIKLSDIWEYKIQNNSWQYISSYPGKLNYEPKSFYTDSFAFLGGNPHTKPELWCFSIGTIARLAKTQNNNAGLFVSSINSNYITINNTNTVNQTGTFILYDVKGVEIIHTELNLNSKEQKMLDIGNLGQAMYLYHFNGKDNYSQSGKIVINK